MIKPRIASFKSSLQNLLHVKKFDAADAFMNLRVSKFKGAQFGVYKGCEELMYCFKTPYNLPGIGNQFVLSESELSKVSTYIQETGHEYPSALNEANVMGNQIHLKIECGYLGDLTPQE